jgi:hypothetical protein
VAGGEEGGGHKGKEYKKINRGLFHRESWKVIYVCNVMNPHNHT